MFEKENHLISRNIGTIQLTPVNETLAISQYRGAPPPFVASATGHPWHNPMVSNRKNIITHPLPGPKKKRQLTNETND